MKILNWISTLWGGTLRFKTPLYFSLGFIAMFTMGGLSGVMHASPPVDLQQTDSYFVVAHFHYVLFGGSIFGLFSGIYYWWPKISGRLLDERLGLWHFWLMMIGFNVTFFPQHFLGVIGMPRRIYTYAPDLGWNFWNLVSTIGALIIVLSFLVFIVNVVKTMRSGTVAGPDPWDGRTLEWSIPSPPPVYNFAIEPTVHDRDEFWLQKNGDGHGGKPAAAAAGRHPPGHRRDPHAVAVVLADPAGARDHDHGLGTAREHVPDHRGGPPDPDLHVQVRDGAPPPGLRPRALGGERHWPNTLPESTPSTIPTSGTPGSITGRSACGSSSARTACSSGR